MVSRPWDESEAKQLVELHGQGASLREIARQMRRSKDTISRRAVSAGLSFDRSVTAEATKAAKEDAKARRTALELNMLGDLEVARLRFGKAQTPREFQSVAQGMDALMRSYVNLLRQSPDDGGLEEAQGILGKIFAAVTVSVEGQPRMNPTAPRLEV